MGLPQSGLWVKKLWVLLEVAVHVVVGKVLLILFPDRVKRNILAMGEKTGMTRNPHFSHDNWIPTFFSTQYFWFVLKLLFLPELPSPPLAHSAIPAYGWAFKNNMDIRNHRNLQDRLQAAHLLLARSPQCPVVVDTMQNQSSQLYAALPERLYVIQEGRILYKGKSGPWNYNPEEVRAVLEKLCS
ncbi:hypothetical protein H8958_018480 [Nasalis larvatus]